jgi:hypothetical protein
MTKSNTAPNAEPNQSVQKRANETVEADFPDAATAAYTSDKLAEYGTGGHPARRNVDE